uniref:Replication factor C C-terminal domain-containing protein n=1 Tax=viral metagenome TaxID=1070528 RepID=A0A6C0BAV1_9ZZZZ
MKINETRFEEYISANQEENLHPKLDKIIKKFPEKMSELKNIIFYGPSGVGKYTQMLHSIKKYSPTELKYEKKICVTFNKVPYFFKISDIHYEIDMSLIGCNSKLFWHDIYLQIVDIIATKPDKSGIILCKYFHEIHSELLENFYSYIQQNNASSISLKFILITEELTFLPDNILNCCEVIHVARPTKAQYNKCIQNKLPIHSKLENITNIKNLHFTTDELMKPHKFVCDKIIESMINIDDMKFLKFRDLLYDIFIYNLNITDCIWYILFSLIEQKKIQSSNFSTMLVKTYNFFQYYNNNYRPIYHIENYLFYLVTIIHKYE